MNYIGSKLSLLPFIESTIRGCTGDDLSGKVFCDIFAGTGIVGRHFKSYVRKVISNDTEVYSYVLNRNYIGNNMEIPGKEELVGKLNSLPPCDDGFIFRNYCPGGGSGRIYFSDGNGRKIDAVRKQIERWLVTDKISCDGYYFLLCSLLESADRVANTASTYAAFLKHLKPSAGKPLSIEPASFVVTDGHHEVYRMDANELVMITQGDILYLDPPYNGRQYGAYYHLLNTIAVYEPFVPRGRAGLDNYYRSQYCRKGWVIPAFENLVRNASFRYIFMSYNNEGLMSPEDIRKVMSRYGRYDLAETPYRRFRQDKEENRNHKADRTVEYIHILEKNG